MCISWSCLRVPCVSVDCSAERQAWRGATTYPSACGSTATLTGAYAQAGHVTLKHAVHVTLKHAVHVTLKQAGHVTLKQAGHVTLNIILFISLSLLIRPLDLLVASLSISRFIVSLISVFYFDVTMLRCYNNHSLPTCHVTRCMACKVYGDGVETDARSSSSSASSQVTFQS